MTGGADRPVVAVVGGGIAGLTAAFDLAGRGCRSMVLEAADQVGGAVARHTVAGIELDSGAESFAVARPAVAQLLDDLGMTELMVEPAPLPAWVRHEAGTAPLPGSSLLGIPGRPLSADVRRVIGAAGVARALGDRLLPPRVAGATLGALVRRRMGTAVLYRLVEAVVGGVHAADPSVLETDAVAPGLIAALGSYGSLAGAVQALRGDRGRSGAAVAGIRGGMSVLPAALVTAIEHAGGEIRCGAEVSALEWSGAEWLAQAPGGPVRADGVVVALPAAGASDLLGPLVAGAVLPTAEQPTSVAVVTLVLDAPQLDAAPRGTGVLVAPRASGVRAKALTHATAKWPWLAEGVPAGRHVLRLSYGRGGFTGSAGSSIPADAELPALALADAAVLLGVELSAAAVAGSAVVRWPSSLPQSRAGHAAAVDAFRAAVGTRRGLATVGSALAGTGLAAVVGDARAQARLLADRMGLPG